MRIVDKCTHPRGSAASGAYQLSQQAVWNSAKLKWIEIRPRDIAYGGPAGFETLLGNKLLEGLLVGPLEGAYYPEQVMNITVVNSD